MLSELSSPVDPREPLRKEIKRLKDQYKTLEIDFAYYEDSNGRLQLQVDKQGAEIEKKDLDITYLKELIERRSHEQETTYEEVDNLRRDISVLEIRIKAQEIELKTTFEVERLLTDREAEVRQFSTELHEVKTDRDDQLAEVKGLEGDLQRQILALEAKEQETDSLHERIDIFERHIRITKGLSLEELDDCLYDFVEKFATKNGDVAVSSAKKENRNSFTPTGGFSLADEFNALSDDEEYDSGDDGGSDTRSVISDVSVESRRRKAKQMLAMSAMQSVEFHPSIKKLTMTSTGTQMSPISPKTIKALPQMTSGQTQTSPTKSPLKLETTSTETQTSPIVPPIKAQVTNTGTQYTPIASPVNFAAPIYTSTETQTSPVVSPVKAQTNSTETQTSPVSSPNKAQTTNTETQSVPVAPRVKVQTTSTGTQHSPIPSPTKAQLTSTGTQYSPTTSPIKSKYASNETQTGPVDSPITAQDTNTGSQTSLVASPVEAQSTGTETQYSPMASPVKSNYASNGTQMSSIAPLTKTQSSPVAPAVKPKHASSETQTSPVAVQNSTYGIQTNTISSPRRHIFGMISSFEVIRSAVQTRPIVATLAKSTHGTASWETQKGPNAMSPKDAAPETTDSAAQISPIVASYKEPIPARIGTEVQNSPVSTLRENAISTTPESETLQPTSDANAQQQFSSRPQTAADSGVQSRTKDALSNLPEARAASFGVDTSPDTTSPSSPNINTLNTKRPRVPAKHTTPTTLSPLRTVTVPSTGNPVLTPSASPNSATPDLATVPTFWQHAHLQPQALLSYSLAVCVGFLLSKAVYERQWAQVNGYAPENEFIYVGKYVVSWLEAVPFAIFAYFWHAVFGDWVFGAGYQRPLSPG